MSTCKSVRHLLGRLQLGNVGRKPLREVLGREETAVWTRRCLHTLVTFMNLVALLYGLKMWVTASNEYLKLPFYEHGYKYKSYFLSLWAVAAHYIYCGMYSAIDVIEIYYPPNEKIKEIINVIHNIASYLLFTIIFPLSHVVMLFFWSAYFWDREMIYPALLDTLLPFWVNHVMHTFPGPLSVIYMLTSNRKEPPKRVTLPGLAIFIVVYASLMFKVKVEDGTWIYLAMNTINQTLVYSLLAVAFLGVLMFHSAGYKVYSLIKGLKTRSSLLSVF